MRPQLNSSLMMLAFDEYVTGHKDAKKALIVMLNRARLRCFQKYEKLMASENLVSPLKILLIGASGTGKTHLMNTLENVMAVPVLRLDATQLNPTGASGGIKSDKMEKLIYEKASEFCKQFPGSFEYIELAIDHTIVYIDEIDKLGSSFDTSGAWNKHVQANFLTVFDNSDILSGVSFVFSGAFTGITTEQTPKNTIGFRNASAEEPTQCLDDRIVASGLIPELVGRINAIVELDKFDVNTYVSIINERILPKKRLDLAAYGMFEIDLNEEEIYDIAQRASKSTQGVRFAKREVDKIFLDKEYEADDLSIYSHNKYPALYNLTIDDDLEELL